MLFPTPLSCVTTVHLAIFATEKKIASNVSYNAKKIALPWAQKSKAGVWDGSAVSCKEDTKNLCFGSDSKATMKSGNS